LHALANRVAAAIHSGAISEIRKRDWRLLPWCLWLKDRPLAEDRRVLDSYLGWLRMYRGRRAYNALIAAYLTHFHVKRKSIEEIAAELSRVVNDFDWPWSERHRLYFLFSPDKAPNAVAEAVLSESSTAESTLSSIGLGGDLARQGLSREAVRNALAIYRDNARPTNQTARTLTCILQWLEEDGNIRFPGMIGTIADALLLPWDHQKQEPPIEIRDATRDFLLKHFKDLRRNPGLWNEVSIDAQAIMRRWLARESLDQFLDIVDDIASPDLKLQWPYRRAFWDAYYKANAITEAWVAFATDGARRARRIDGDHLRFGRLKQISPVQPNHAVLLLKIGSLTVAEWSENGKCYIWRSDNAAAPKLYGTEYTRDNLVSYSSNGGQIHGGSAYGSWQKNVVDFIARSTRIRLQEADYMPNRRGRRG